MTRLPRGDGAPGTSSMDASPYLKLSDVSDITSPSASVRECHLKKLPAFVTRRVATRISQSSEGRGRRLALGGWKRTLGWRRALQMPILPDRGIRPWQQ